MAVHDGLRRRSPSMFDIGGEPTSVSEMEGCVALSSIVNIVGIEASCHGIHTLNFCPEPGFLKRSSEAFATHI